MIVNFILIGSAILGMALIFLVLLKVIHQKRRSFWKQVIKQNYLKWRYNYDTKSNSK